MRSGTRLVAALAACATLTSIENPSALPGQQGPQVPAAAPAPPPPATEIYLAPFREGEGRTIRIAFIGIQKVGVNVGKPVNITNNPGYDNQPYFLPDSSGLLFSSNRDGRQTDIYRYDIAAKR